MATGGPEPRGRGGLRGAPPGPCGLEDLGHSALYIVRSVPYILVEVDPATAATVPEQPPEASQQDAGTATDRAHQATFTTIPSFTVIWAKALRMV